MTIITDLQKQVPGSELVELYEIEKPNGTFAYLTPGQDSDGSSLQIYDYDSNSTTRTYTPIPISSDGFEIKVTGAIARPVFNVSNVGTTFTTLMGTTDIDLLVGKKFIRRLTLKKYLKGESADPGSGNTPVEFVRQVWTINRIQAEDSTTINFELAAPFDLEGVRIPARNIISNACPWEYTGASADLSESAKCGACTWNREGKFTRRNVTPGGVNPNGTEHTVYVTLDNEYVLPSTTSFTNYTSASSSTSFTVDTVIKTTGNSVTKVNANGTYSTVTVDMYWQVATAGAKSALGTPSDTNTNFKRLRVHQGTYSNSTTYNAFTDDRLNDMVTATADGLTFLWKTKVTHSGNTPAFGKFWRRGDECGKTLESCNTRFGFNPVDATSATSLPKAATSTNQVLPFGAFPGAKNFQ